MLHQNIFKKNYVGKMIILRNLKKNKNFKNSVIAIGNFDGIHLGHQKVLAQAYKKAKKEKLKFGVVTFEPVPVMFFNKKIKHHRINNLNQKINSLKKLKIDFISIIKFNKAFSNLSSDQFIKKIIFKYFQSKFIFISKNFRFGKNREGNIQTLKDNEKNFSYKTIITKPLKINNLIISSSLIRKKIFDGKINIANKLLGRLWSVEGKIIKGKQRGRKMGFPTCNLELNSYTLPKLGVYAVNIRINNLSRNGVANIGYRPTFNGNKLLLEVNIFGLSANLYKKILTINFIKFIRPEKKFKNIEELKLQIKKDVLEAKK